MITVKYMNTTIILQQDRLSEHHHMLQEIFSKHPIKPLQDHSSGDGKSYVWTALHLSLKITNTFALIILLLVPLHIMLEDQEPLKSLLKIFYNFKRLYW